MCPLLPFRPCRSPFLSPTGFRTLSGEFMSVSFCAVCVSVGGVPAALFMCNFTHSDQTYKDTRVLESLTSDRREPSAHGVLSLWEMIRLVNLLIVFRFLRIIPDIKVRSPIQTRRLSLTNHKHCFQFHVEGQREKYKCFM